MKNITLLFCLCASWLLTACSDSNTAIVQSAVKEKLNDPDSAQFRLITKAKDDQVGGIYCGEVNAKNAMGGYVGYRAFVVIDGKTLSIADRSMPMDEIKAAMKTKPLSGDFKDPVYLWDFCLVDRS